MDGHDHCVEFWFVRDESVFVEKFDGIDGSFDSNIVSRCQCMKQIEF